MVRKILGHVNLLLTRLTPTNCKMDDWDDIVREAGEDRMDTEDTLDENDDFKESLESVEDEQQLPVNDTGKPEAVDHDAPPAVVDEQCRICFCGAEEEPELGVCSCTSL